MTLPSPPLWQMRECFLQVQTPPLPQRGGRFILKRHTLERGRGGGRGVIKLYREIDERCSGCGRKIDDDKIWVYDGKSYHRDCLPSDATSSDSSNADKPSFWQRLYDKLDDRAQDGEIATLDQVIPRIAVELNCQSGYIDYMIKELDKAGYVTREFNRLKLVERPKAD